MGMKAGPAKYVCIGPALMSCGQTEEFPWETQLLLPQSSCMWTPSTAIPVEQNKTSPFKQWNFPPPTNMYVFPILYSSSAPEFLIPSGFLQSHIFPSCAMESTCFSFLFLSLATREITSSHNRICKGKKGKFQLTLEKNCARKLLKKRAWPKMFLKA